MQSTRIIQMNNWRRRIEILTNICVITAVLLLCGVLIKRYFYPFQVKPAGNTQAGDKNNYRGRNTVNGDAKPLPPSVKSGELKNLVEDAPQNSSVMSQPRLVINESAESIGMTDLKHALEAGQPLIMLDVRERAAFVQRHIKPAINIPVDELEVRAVNELSPSDLIVAYCGCEDDGDSKVARKILYAQGFRRVVILHDETAKEACATCK